MKSLVKAVLLGGVTIIVMICAAYAWFIMSPSLREELPKVVSKGILLPGASSGRQTITDPLERHLYEFSGEANQTIEIRLHPFSDVYMMGIVRADGYKKELAMDSTGIEGKLGDDLTMTVFLPETRVYQILVDMVDPYIGDYEVQIDILPE